MADEKQQLIQKIRLIRSIRKNRHAQGQTPEQEQTQRTQGVEKQIGERQAIPFRPVQTFFDPTFAIQNIAAAGQREESGIAQAIRSGIKEQKAGGDLGSILKSALSGGATGLAGTKGLTEIGDIPREAGVDEDKSALIGLAGSAVLPSSLATLGLGKGSLSAGAARKATTLPGKLFRFAGDVGARQIKNIRKVIDKLGVGKVFSPEVESAEFVGKFLTPEVSNIVKQNVDNLQKPILDKIGVDPELGAEVRKAGLEATLDIGTKIRTVIDDKISSARKLFEDAFNKADPDTTINIKKVKGRIGAVLKQAGIIDEKGAFIPEIGSDPAPIKGLKTIFSQLKQRISKSRPKRIEAEITRQPISPEALAFQLKTGKKTLPADARATLKEASIFTDELDIPTLNRLRTNLRNLVTGEGNTDRFVLQVIDSLEQAAEDSGLKGLKEARQKFRIAKQFQEKFLKVADRAKTRAEALFDPEKVNSLLNRGQSIKNEPTKEVIKKILGPRAEDILARLEANRLLVNPKELGKISGRGIVSSARGLARGGVRSFEESVSPGIRKFGRKTAPLIRPFGGAVKTGTALGERAVIRRGLGREQ